MDRAGSASAAGTGMALSFFFLLLNNTVLFHRLVNNSICPSYCTNCWWKHVCVARSGYLFLGGPFWLNCWYNTKSSYLILCMMPLTSRPLLAIARIRFNRSFPVGMVKNFYHAVVKISYHALECVSLWFWSSKISAMTDLLDTSAGTFQCYL